MARSGAIARVIREAQEPEQISGQVDAGALGLFRLTDWRVTLVRTDKALRLFNAQVFGGLPA